MMARPTDAGNFAESIYAQFPQSIRDLDVENDYALLIFLGAIGQAFQQIDTLAHADGLHDPWTMLLDVNRIPDEGVPWLGQFVGVSINTALTVDNQRQQIRDHIGWQRGTIQSLIRVIQPFLTGSKTVVITERDTSPYHFGITTYQGETPPDTTLQDLYNSYATIDAFFIAWGSFEDYWLSLPRNFLRDVVIPLNKPAALQFTYTVTPGFPGSLKTLETLYLHWKTLRDIYEAYQTIDDVYTNP